MPPSTAAPARPSTWLAARSAGRPGNGAFGPRRDARCCAQPAAADDEWCAVPGRRCPALLLVLAAAPPSPGSGLAAPTRREWRASLILGIALPAAGTGGAPGRSRRSRPGPPRCRWPPSLCGSAPQAGNSAVSALPRSSRHLGWRWGISSSSAACWAPAPTNGCSIMHPANSPAPTHSSAHSSPSSDHDLGQVREQNTKDVKIARRG